ncbi:MAG: PAS domain S-box protein [candidate division WOR-3 bacterium]|nr:MAG: PAS domain S-box protein [candidate division WOR-3 bacterium]
MKKRILLLLRFVLILATILMMTYSRRGLHLLSPGYLVALLYFISNIVFYFIPEHKFSRPVVTFAIFLIDIIAISLAIYLAQGMQTDFYLIYFLIIFIASVGQDLRGSIPIAVVASFLYGWLLMRTNPGTSIFDSAILIRIPFIFIVSIISSYWSTEIRRELSEKKELENFARRLEQEIAKMAADETDLKSYHDTVINSVASGVIAVSKDGTITTINPEAARVLGASQSSFMDKNIKDIEGLEQMWDKMREVIGSNTPSDRIQISIKNADDETIPIGLSVSPMSSTNATISGCVGILRDLSDIKALEAKLRHAERLSYLGKMASWVAHEIRNPLTAIDGFSQLLAKTRDQDKLKAFSTEIHRGTQRINHIIDDILTFARTKTHIKAVDIHLRGLITQLTENMGNVRIFISGDVDTLIKGEEESLKSLFNNLISNSVDAMDKDPKITIKFYKEDQWLITELADNGKGMSDETVQRLFTPFFTTKSRGTGLGLAIVKKIVDDHGGKLEIESEEGKGTTCRVYLPAVEE